MRHLWQRIVGWITIYTIVLQAFAVGLTPASATPVHGFDPLSIICANGASVDTQDTAPGIPIAHGCDHCILCSATTPPDAPNAATKISFRAPVLAFSWPTYSLPARYGLDATPELPTGPPASV